MLVGAFVGEAGVCVAAAGVEDAGFGVLEGLGLDMGAAVALSFL